jgi:hypothetical protein
MVRAESLPQRGCRSGCPEDRRLVVARQWPLIPVVRGRTPVAAIVDRAILAV